MPMEDSYWEQMKSPIADMKNTGGRMGGAITAALFLREYVDTDKVCHAAVEECFDFLRLGPHVLACSPERSCYMDWHACHEVPSNAMHLCVP